MSEKIVQLNEEVFKVELRELVHSSVEETLNSLLEAKTAYCKYSVLAMTKSVEAVGSQSLCDARTFRT